ncbi:MAG: ABC transporter permease, partial [Alphaproteobacteria bacterium]
ISFAAYVANTVAALSPNDVLSGLSKSVLFAALIAIIGAVNGSLVSGGAEGVGRMTTRAVVHAISSIIVADMIFGLLVTR